jgi:hypothetical protein
MVDKQTYSEPITVWSPDTEGNTVKQIATSPREITNLKLVASGGAAHIDLYDNAAGGTSPNDLVWTLDASTTANDSDLFVNPLFFKKGIYAVLTQGTGFNPQLSLAIIPDKA